MRALLTVSDAESLVIMMGNLEVDRHGVAAVTESFHLVHKHKAERENNTGEGVVPRNFEVQPHWLTSSNKVTIS